MALSFAGELAPPEGYLPPAPRDILATRSGQAVSPRLTGREAVEETADLQEKVDHVINYLEAQGFVFEPWQVASFITAARTKPFVILAGISGTGKTKLPRLVAEATDAESTIVPVRPDWTDSSELLGYERLDGSFQPGALLRFAKKAQENPEKQFFFVLDEMNIARVEYYLAEVLSHLEERHPDAEGRLLSQPLIPHARQGAEGNNWKNVSLPDNLCIVGSVNMDETTHGFSKKVLDRAFVIEFSTIDLTAIGESVQGVIPSSWSSADWRVLAPNLVGHPARSSPEVPQIVDTLSRINDTLQQAQLQFGYRVRDEIVMFCLAAKQCSSSFMTADAGVVDPLDLSIAMKVLPRIQGGGIAIKKVLEDLQRWAAPEKLETTIEPGRGENTGFPFCADRIALMLRRLKDSGFTNYWL